MIKELAVTAGIAAAIGLGTASLVTENDQHTQITRLERQVSQLNTSKAAVEYRLSTLEGQMNSLTQPTDPLAAYNQICNVQLTNGTTGVLQTYYYPCTNNVQTIPQPGN